MSQFCAKVRTQSTESSLDRAGYTVWQQWEQKRTWKQLERRDTDSNTVNWLEIDHASELSNQTTKQPQCKIAIPKGCEILVATPKCTMNGLWVTCINPYLSSTSVRSKTYLCSLYYHWTNKIRIERNVERKILQSILLFENNTPL